MKKKSVQERRLLKWIGFGAVLLLIASAFLFNPFSSTGLAIHSAGSEVVTLDLSGSVPAGSKISYIVGEQIVVQDLLELGFGEIEVIDEENVTSKFIPLSPVDVNISSLGFNLKPADYTLEVIIDNLDQTLSLPLTVDQEIVDTPISAPQVVVTPDPIDPADFIASLEDLPQGAIIVGKPVKWKRVVSLTEEKSNFEIELPPEAENIVVRKVVDTEEVPVDNIQVSDQSRLA